MKLLLLEDEPVLQKVIVRFLQGRGFEVSACSTVGDAIGELKSGQDFVLFVVDVMLPDGNGIAFLEQLKATLFAPKVIIVSADSRIQTIEKAFLSGCEDYLKKPFDIQELGLKIDKLLGRLSQEIIIGNEIVYERVSHILTIKGEVCKLSPREGIFFDVLVQNIGCVVKTKVLEEVIWGGKAPSNDALRTMIKRVRRKIGEGMIENVSGVGYKLVKG
ncbi:MAG: response regulator transcription factor [Wolinella sp.]